MNRFCLLMGIAVAFGCAESKDESRRRGPSGAALGDSMAGDADPGDGTPGDQDVGDTELGDGESGDEDVVLPPVDCSTVTVLGDWTGVFEGDLTTPIDPTAAPVNGELALSFTCEDEQVSVTGSLVGEGCYDGYCVPFLADTIGYYRPDTNELVTDIDGRISVDVFMIPFFGTMNGSLGEGRFTGVWDASGEVTDPYSGTTFDVFGDGTWEADPAAE